MNVMFISLIVGAFGTIESNVSQAQDEKPTVNFGVTISRDEQDIIFYSSRGTPLPDLYIRNSMGKEKNLTNTPDIWEIEPSYSPDSKWVTYSMGESMRDLDIYMLNVENGQSHKLIGGSGTQAAAKWHPSGNKLIYTQFDMGERTMTSTLWTIDSQGENNTQLTGLPLGASSYPSWSPDGSKIVYVNEGLGEANSQFYIYDFETKQSKQITTGEYWKGTPVFSNSGDEIYFVARLSPNSGVYKMSLDGNENVIPVASSENENAHFVAISPKEGNVYFSWGNQKQGYDFKVISSQ